ncbi:MAG: MFS transporter [Propionibacteriaceae bacterium]|jgi:DHA3 family macrolide efflux protein-like MFS transporter|nr:MFS transporter [Propionibacteriaceae bacterium]
MSPSDGPSPAAANGPAPSAPGFQPPADWKRILILIWTGQAFSIVTSYAAGYAAIWYITETTGSAMMLSLAAIVSILPTGLLSPFGGVLADRFNRRSLMLLADGAVGALSALLGLVIWLGQVNLPVTMVVLGVRGVAQAFHGPALTAAMPLLAPPSHLLRINTLSQMLWSLAGIGAPALGILLYSTIGFHSVMFLDALGAVLACAGLALVRLPTVRDQGLVGRDVWHGLGDGLRVVRANRGLSQLMLICTLGMVLFSPIGSLLPLMTYGHFAGDGYDASLIEAVFGIAMLAGSFLLLAWGGGRRHVRLVLGSGLAAGLTIFGCGLLPTDRFIGFVILCGAMGFACAFYNGPLMTVLQRHSPAEKMGRVMGLFGAVVSLAAPIGLVVSGAVAERVGIASWFLISGGAIVVLTLPAALMRQVRALDVPGPNGVGPAEPPSPADLSSPADPASLTDLSSRAEPPHPVGPSSPAEPPAPAEPPHRAEATEPAATGASATDGAAEPN